MRCCVLIRCALCLIRVVEWPSGVAFGRREPGAIGASSWVGVLETRRMRRQTKRWSKAQSAEESSRRGPARRVWDGRRRQPKEVAGQRSGRARPRTCSAPASRAMSAHSDGRLPPTRADAGLRPTSTDDDESSLIFLYVYTVFPRSQSRSRSRSRKECDFSIRNI